MKREKKAETNLNREIETLREQLYRQKDITHRDTLKLSAELDLLILKAMKNSRPGFKQL